jgi:hypothetical protein
MMVFGYQQAMSGVHVFSPALFDRGFAQTGNTHDDRSAFVMVFPVMRVMVSTDQSREPDAPGFAPGLMQGSHHVFKNHRRCGSPERVASAEAENRYQMFQGCNVTPFRLNRSEVAQCSRGYVQRSEMKRRWHHPTASVGR